ncbi:hypothetical protein Tco_0532644 [Tanacetum coccineum]
MEGTILEEKLFVEFDEFMAMTTNENSESESDTEEPPFEKITFNTNCKIKTSLEEPLTDLKLTPLLDNLEYAFLEEPSFLHVIISSQLSEQNKNKLVFVLKRHKQAFSLKTTDILGISTFQRCMLAIFHDMIEVFMDDFSVFGNSFDNCLNNLDKMLQHCKAAHLVLNWEKCHLMVKEGIVLGHKVSEAGLEVDKAKINIISKLLPPLILKATNPSEPSPFSYFYNADYDNISTPSTTYTIHLTKSATIITTPFELTRRIYHNHNIFYDGDDGEELFSDEYGESECDVPDCDDSQTTNFSTFSNPLFDDSTSSDDESSHEEVIHEISFKTYSNPLFDLDEEIISSEFNPIHNEDLDSTLKNDRFDTESYLLESLLNRDTLMASSPKIDSLFDEFAGELITIPPRIVNREHEEYISLLERIVTLLEENDIFPGLYDSIPPGIESDDYDSKGDDNSTSLPEFESFHVDYPDLGYSTIDVVEDIPVDVPNILPTYPTLHMDFDFIPSHNDLGSDLDVSSLSGDRNKIYDPRICIEVESTRFLATLSPRG